MIAMHAHDRGATGTDCPASTFEELGSPVPRPSSLDRVGAFLQAWATREVSDDELRQHAADCTDLMEQAYARFQRYHDPADREHGLLWMHGRDETLRALSPAFKAAREAQIQQQISEGVGYFIDQADAARARLTQRGAR